MKKQLLLVGLLLGLVACKETLPPEEVVKQRITERWAIRKSKSIDGLYEFLSPSQRQITDRPSYERSLGMAVTYLNEQIKSIKCNGSEEKEADACHAEIYVTVKVNKKGYPDAGATIKETWVLEDGNWWITLD